MGKTASAPPTPDYAGAATAQGAANVEAARATAKLSNPNIVGPYGTQTVSYGEGGNADIPTVTQTLNPAAQATLGAQQETQRRLALLGQQGVTTAETALANPYAPTGGAAGGLQTSIGPAATPQTAYDLSGLARMPVDAGTTGQEAIMRRLEPTLARRDASLRQNLANQGLVSGGEAYRNAMTDEGQARNDLLSQAALQGINLDTAARAQGFGEQQAGANLFNTATAQGLNQQQQQAQFGNAAQMQELQRQLALRGQPLNEIGALMSGSQLQLPQFQNYQGQQIAAAPVFNATQAQAQNAFQNYGIQQGGLNATTQGIGQLLGTAGGLYGGAGAPGLKELFGR